ncbi:hypothetical protein [Vibrio sonorensis]|uniref:hypothetical protein n=1 Tax=Vibrio sonorensis TaxID=1004316 RepID=UPI0008DADE77|nr:hypothetical protein [Vibrio sonorensis]
MTKDKGLQRERTQLSWTRSGLVITTGLLMLIKLGSFNLLQLACVILLFWFLLQLVAVRKGELGKQLKVFSLGVLVRNLTLSFSIFLCALWVLIH